MTFVRGRNDLKHPRAPIQWQFAPEQHGTPSSSGQSKIANPKSTISPSPSLALDDNLIRPVRLLEAHVDAVVAGDGRELQGGEVGLDGEFAAVAVHQDGQADDAGAAEVA